jgi:hypothetical protein
LRLCAQSDFGYVAQPLLRFRTREEGHYLSGRDLESCLCLGRIHRDNWYLLHPRRGLRSRWDSMLYEKAKFLDVAMMRAGRRLRKERWGEKEQSFCRSYLSPLSCLLLKGVGMLPLGLVLRFREAYRFYRHRRTRVNKKNPECRQALEKVSE